MPHQDTIRFCIAHWRNVWEI